MMSHQKGFLVLVCGVVLVAAMAVIVGMQSAPIGKTPPTPPVDPTPQPLVLSGVYECLPHKGAGEMHTMECAFGVKADDGNYYAINFGASADAMEQFQSGARVTANGFFVPIEALSTEQWSNYAIRGIFTVTEFIGIPTPTAGKLNIAVVCEEALAYMTFPDGNSADAFVEDCTAGKHPEVIEEHRKRLGVPDEVAL